MADEPKTNPTTETEVPNKVKLGTKEYNINEAESAMNLYNSLKDENTGKEIIEQLARKIGLLDKKDEPIKKPGETDAAAERRFQKTLKAKLGPDFAKFADMVGPVLDDVIEEMFEEHRTSLEGTSDASTWEDETDRFIEGHEINDDIQNKMMEIIKRDGGVPKGLKGKKAQEYLDDKYVLAIHRLGLELKDDGEGPKAHVGRRSRRALDEIPEFREEKRPKGPLTIDQIVDAASRGIRFKPE